MGNKVHIAGQFGGTPSADCRFPVSTYRTGTLSEIRPDKIYQSLAVIKTKVHEQL